jgi:nicotinamide-nucleotide amidase
VDNTERDLAELVGTGARSRDLTVAAAESVTAGRIATALASAGSAADWFSGSIVAYRSSLKQQLLGVTSDRVITPECAIEMATGVLRATGADLAVSVTGVGGPDPEEGRPPGTVFIAVASAQRTDVYDYQFDGTPEEVVGAATRVALRHLADAVAR